MTVMLLGTYQNSIDAKGRCIIPSRFRADLGEKLMLVKGYDSCLYIFTEEAFVEYVNSRILNGSDVDKNSRYLRTAYFYGSCEREVDKQGRINVPQDFLDHAKIKKEMVNIGTLDRVEIWGKEFLEAREFAGELDSRQYMEAAAEPVKG